MKRVVLVDNAGRHVERRRIKQWISDNAIIIALCFLFSILGVLLMENELFEDQWYFEASADGLFGKDNRSLMTLSSNYLIMGIIYWLSLTGIRLNWYNLILIFMNFVSSLLVCKVITTVAKGWYKFLICFVFLAFITTRIYFYFQFTVIATYVASAGCLWLFYSIEQQKSKIDYWFGIIWIILGASIRIDSIIFPIFFMGLVWLFKMGTLFCRNGKQSHDSEIAPPMKTFLRYFLPFGVALLLIAGIEVSQELLMEHVNPGFKDWNATRFHVDDYDLPDYDTHATEYQNIGLSRNDYALLRAWNNFDPDFFTERKYEELAEIRDLYDQDATKNTPPGQFVLDVLRRLTGSICLAMGIIVSICALLFVSTLAGICCTTLVFGAGCLHLYFSYAGRLINRIEYSIWIGTLLAMAAALLILGEVRMSAKKQSRAKKLFISVLCGLIVFARPNSVESSKWAPYCGMSIMDIYRERIVSQNSYGRYICEEGSLNNDVKHGTFDEPVVAYMMQNKDVLFLISCSLDWYQHFPLLGEDVLRSAPVGACENWCTIGQYQTHLSPLRQILKRWQIDNPFKVMTEDNVRLAFKDTEFHDRSYEINTYLKEHYYDDANFSVETVVNRTVIGRYLCNFDAKMLASGHGEVFAIYNEESPYAGMSQITLSNINVEGFFLSQDKAFIEIHSSDSHTYTCTTMESGDGQLTALFYNDIINESENYTVNFIYSLNNQFYEVEADLLR